MEEDPASAAEVYDTSRFSDLYHASRSPSPQHLGLAARFLVSLFRGHSVFFAFLGGWAVYLRGGGRRTEDVDVSVATSMRSLTEILLREERCDEPLISFSFLLLLLLIRLRLYFISCVPSFVLWVLVLYTECREYKSLPDCRPLFLFHLRCYPTVPILTAGVVLIQRLYVLRSDEFSCRICVPKTYGTSCIQIFVHTGGDWDEESPPLCQLAVSVDIIINGTHTSPAPLPTSHFSCHPTPNTTSHNLTQTLTSPSPPQGNLGIPPDLLSATESITPSQPDLNLGPDPVVPVIDVFHQFATKLSVHHARRQPDDYADLEFLADTYPSDIFAVRNYLSGEHREAFWRDYAVRNAAEGDARVKRMRVLLGLSLSL